MPWKRSSGGRSMCARRLAPVCRRAETLHAGAATAATFPTAASSRKDSPLSPLLPGKMRKAAAPIELQHEEQHRIGPRNGTYTTMRYLVCLIGGALLGALIAITIANILRDRHAWPRAVMTVMQH